MIKPFSRPTGSTVRIILLALLLAAWLSPSHAHAQEPPPLARDQIRIVGLSIQPSPDALVVPKNVGTIVTPLLIRSDRVTGELPSLPADAIFQAELRGPAFQQPIPVTAPLNGSLPVPPLPLAGIYTLENIRLTRGATTLILADPDTVQIEVIERVIDTQVEVRQLTAAEIEEKGIFIDQSNFQVVNFTVAFGLEQGTIEIEFPMLMPRSNLPGVPGVPLIRRPEISSGAQPSESELPALKLALSSPNIELSGFGLEVSDPEQQKFNLPPIPGVVLIPGNVGYLNSFFSAIVKVSNAAPAHANLRVGNLSAEILLPPGPDQVLGTSDDPLRMARIGNPPVTQPRQGPVARPGPDNKLGTPDDILELRPQQSGDAEFLIEGLREGTHRINFKIRGTVFGLPSGPVAVEGVAVGTVEVRNPNFALTFHHPEVITAGEEYDFRVTVSNVSDRPANFVSMSLLPRSLSGALLAPNQPHTQQIQSIAPGDAATVVFRLIAQRTGQVTSTSLASNDIPGKFELSMAVGELGIPMSPNVLSLPREARALPADLFDIGIGLLGQAHALSRAPVPPSGLLPLGSSIVQERAIDLTTAGQRFEMGEPLSSVARDLLLDFAGNSFTRIPEFHGNRGPQRVAGVEKDYRAWDELLRRSRRGAAFNAYLSQIFATEAQANGALAFQQSFAQGAVSRPAHLSVLVGGQSGARPELSLLSPQGKRLGCASTAGAASCTLVREIAYGTWLPLDDAGVMALVSVPEAGRYEASLTGGDGSPFDLGVVLPAGSDQTGLRRWAFAGITMSPGARARLVLLVGPTPSAVLEIDGDGDGQFERTIAAAEEERVAEGGPTLLAARSIYIPTPRQHISKYGVIVALLFSEEVDPDSAQHNVEEGQLTAYTLPNNRVESAYVQPRGRVVTLRLRDGIGPFVERDISVTGLEDRLGHPMSPISQSLALNVHKPPSGGLPETIVPGPAGRVHGTVRRPDGKPVPFARIFLSYREVDLNDEPYWVVLSVRDADDEGGFSYDFVRVQPVRWTYFDPETGERGELVAQPSHDSEVLALDLVLRGRGSISGQVRSVDGTLLEGVYVRSLPISAHLTGDDVGGQVFTDAEGRYLLSGVPVGSLSIDAVHQATRSQVKTTLVITQPGSMIIQDLVLLSIDNPLNFGAVEGQVFRSDGRTAAAGVPVYTSRGGTATTNEAGAYRIEGLAVGELTVRAIDLDSLEEASVRTTLIASRTVPANLLLSGGRGTIRGTVFDSDGNRLVGLPVYGGWNVVITDEEGEFVLTDIPVGSRRIDVLDESSKQLVGVTAQINGPGDEASIQIVLPVTGVLTGKVQRWETNPRRLVPVPNLEVFALGSRNEVAVTGADGAYRFEKMPKGEYTISAFLPDLTDGNIARTKIVFKDEVRIANVTFLGHGTVTGTVYDDDGRTPLGARVSISELVVKEGRLIPRENPLCLPTVELPGGEKFELPECKRIGLGFETVSHYRQMNNHVSSGSFTFAKTFVGPFTVSSANPFSPKIVSTSDVIPEVGATRRVTLSLQATGVVSGVVLLPNGTSAGSGIVVALSGMSAIRDEFHAITDDDGHFHYPLVPAGGFAIVAEEDGGEERIGQTLGSVGVGAQVEVSVRLLRTGTVSVTVLGATGPVAGADVTLSEGNFPRTAKTFRTNSAGQVIFGGGDAVHEGPFSVRAYDAATGVSGYKSGLMKSVTDDPEGSVQITLTLPTDAGSVAGRFLRSDGVTGIPGAQVILRSHGEQLFAVTSISGTFRFDGVLLGAVSLDAYDPVTGRWGRASGHLATHGELLTLNMVQISLGQVSGTVTRSSDRKPVAYANISLQPGGGVGSQLHTTADSGGWFSVQGVPAGSFLLYARDPQYGLQGTAAGTLSQEGETVQRDVVILIEPLGTVIGQVTTALDEPAVGAHVTLYHPGGGATLATTVDSSGHYTIENVRIAPVVVQARAAIGGDAGEAAGAVLSDGDVEVVNIRMVGSGTVSGRVLSAAGEPVSAATVSVVRKSTTIPYFNRSGAVDSQGEFRFTHVPLGTLEISSDQSVQQLGGGATATLSTPGETLFVTITLEAAGSLFGSVLGENGLPAPGIALELVQQNSSNPVKRYGSSDSEGRFRFDNLRLGAYKLVLSDPTGSGIGSAQETLSNQGEALDMGAIRLDETAPSVLSITPADGAIDQPVDSQIRIRFSEPILAASMSGSLRVTRSGQPVAGSWSLSSDQTEAIFVPSADYPDFARISVVATTGLRDLANRPLVSQVSAAFTTADSTPPAYVAISPAPDALGVGVDSLIRIQFSESLSISLATGTPVTLTLAGAVVPTSKPVELLLNGTTLLLTPRDILNSDTVYQVEIEPVADRYGNRQSTGKIYTFRTQDLVAPVLAALNSSAGSQLRSGTTTTIVPDLDGVGDIASVEYFVNGVSRHLAQSAPFAYEYAVNVTTATTATVAAQATDHSGNRSESRSLLLELLPDLAPELRILAPVDGSSIGSGQRITVTVVATDDFELSRIFFQTKQALNSSQSTTAAPGTKVITTTYLVDVPASVAPGSLLIIEASAQDKAGLSGSVRRITLPVEDRTRPTVTFTTPPAQSFVDAGETVTISLSLSDNGPLHLVSLKATGGATFSQTRVVSPSVSTTIHFPIVVDTSAQPTQTIELEATAIDLAGNRSLSILRTLGIRDRQPPLATITLSGAEVVAGGSISATVKVTDLVGVTGVTLTARGAYTTELQRTLPASPSSEPIFVVTVPPTATVGGEIRFRAEARDAAGNLGASAEVGVTVLADQPPHIRIIEPDQGTAIATGTPLSMTLAISDDLGVEQIRLQSSGAFTTGQVMTLTPSIPGGQVQLAVEIPADAPLGAALVISVTAIDSRGQSSIADAVELVVGQDRTRPSLIIEEPVAGSLLTPGRPFSVTLSATDSGGLAQLSLRLGGALDLTRTIDITPTVASVRQTLVFTLPAGSTASESVELTAEALDRAGNEALTRRLSLGVRDVFSPTAVLSLPAGTDAAIRGESLVVSVRGTDEIGVVTLSLSAQGAFSVTQSQIISPSAKTTIRNFNLTVPLSATVGTTVTLVARSQDGAGNTGFDRIELPVIDDERPRVTIEAPATVASGSVFSLTLSASDDHELSEVRLELTGALVASRLFTPNAATLTETLVFTVSSQTAPGSQITLNASARDQRGRTATATPASILIVDGTPPLATITQPANGSRLEPGSEHLLRIQASDNGAVSQIQLIVEGAEPLSVTRIISPAVSSVQATFTISIPASIAAGTEITATVTAVDAAGLRSAEVVSHYQVKDIEPPVVTLIGPPSAEVVQGRTFSMTIAANDNAGVSLTTLRTRGALTGNETRTYSAMPRSVVETFLIQVPVSLQPGSVISVTGEAQDTSQLVSVSALITLTVRASDAQLSGLVNGGSGPVADAQVFVLAAARFYSTTTDSTGYYEMSGLPDGVVLVQARRGDGLGYGRAQGTLSTSGLQLDIDLDDELHSLADFSNDTDGWGSEGSGTLFHSSSLHTLAFNDSAITNAPAGWFKAPLPFLGELSHAYGDSLSYRIRHNNWRIEAYHESDVILRGGGLELHFRSERSVSSNWRYINVPLDARVQNWRIVPDNRPPSESEFRSVLADLQALLIRADYLSITSESTYLDQVRLGLPLTRVFGTVTNHQGDILVGAPVTLTTEGAHYHLVSSELGFFEVRGVGMGTVEAETVWEGVRRYAVDYLEESATELEFSLQVPLLPVLEFVQPQAGAEIIEGMRVNVVVSATSALGPDEVEVHLDGEYVTTLILNEIEPNHFAGFFDVPLGVAERVLSAETTDWSENRGTTAITISVVADPGATVIGRVLDPSGTTPIEGARIEARERIAFSDVDGYFEINGLASSEPDVYVSMRAFDGQGLPLQAFEWIMIEPGATVDLGDVLLEPGRYWDGEGGDGSWQNRLNWSDDQIPSNDEDVYIPAGARVEVKSGVATAYGIYGAGDLAVSGGTFNPYGDVRLAQLTQSGGFIGGSGTISVSQFLTWTGGMIQDGGRVVNLGVGLITGGTMSERELVNRGVLTWQADATLHVRYGAAIRNKAGATFTIVAGDGWYDVDWDNSLGDQPLLHNDGLIVRRGGNGQIGIDARLINGSGGEVRVESGSLRLGGGGESDGTLSVEAGARLLLPSAFRLSGSETTGDGLIEMGAGPITFGANLTVGPEVRSTGQIDMGAFTASFTRLTLDSASLTGSAEVTVTQGFTLHHGVLLGSGRLTLLGDGHITGGIIDARTVDNHGSLRWRAAFGMTVRNAARLINRPGATFEMVGVDIEREMDWHSGLGVQPVLENHGLILRTGSGVRIVLDLFVDNRSGGEIRVASGRLKLGGGSSGAGLIETLTGSEIELGGSLSTTSTSSIRGGGLVRFAGSGSSQLFGRYEVTGTTEINGGTLTIGPDVLNGPISKLNLLVGTLAFSSGAPILIDDVLLRAGTLSGSDPLVVRKMVWEGGTISGSGAVDVSETLQLATSAIKTLSGRSLKLLAQGEWLDGMIMLNNDAGFTVALSARLDIRTHADIGYSGNRPTVVNEGLISYRSLTDWTQINPAFDNRGRVDVEAGVLRIGGGGTQSGTIHVLPGARLDFTDQPYNHSAGALLSGDAVRFVSANHVLGGRFEISSTTEIFGGTVLVDHRASTANFGRHLRLVGGTLSLNRASVHFLDQVTLEGGVVDGTDDIVVTTQTTWKSGTIGGGGRITTLGTARFETSSSRTLSGRLWENGASLEWADGSLLLTNGARLVNLAGGVIDIQKSGTVLGYGGVRPVLRNEGLLRKSTAGESSMTVDVQNAGRIEVKAGHLLISSAYEQTTTGVLQLDIEGPTASTQLHQLRVSGAATLNGTLALNVSGGYEPLEGVQLALLTYGSRNGAFSTVSGGVVGSDRHIEVSYDDSGKRVVGTVVSGPANQSGEAQPQPESEPEPLPSTLPLYLPQIIADVQGETEQIQGGSSAGAAVFLPTVMP